MFLFAFLFYWRSFSSWSWVFGISHFLIAALIFSCFLPMRLFSVVYYLSLYVFLCYPRQWRQDFEILSKKRLGFVVVFLSLKVRVAVRFTAKTRGCLKCEILPRLTGGGVRLSEQKFLGCIDNQVFLLMVPHRARVSLKRICFEKCPDSCGHGTWVYTRDCGLHEKQGTARGSNDDFLMSELGRVPLSSACSNLSTIVCSKPKFRGLNGKNIEKR